MSQKTDGRIKEDALLGLRSDKAIAADTRSALLLDYKLPADRIAVSVVDGYVTLIGNVDWHEQKDAAGNHAAMILGVKGVDNQILVNQPQAPAVDILSGIVRAFAQSAHLFDDHINVVTDGGHVTLSGTVATWKERDLAEETVWMSPGVSGLTNNIIVLFPYASLQWR